MSDEDYANIWGEWAQEEEFKQMKIWDNNDRQTHKPTGAAGPVSSYTLRNLPNHMPKTDSTPMEATILEHVPSLPNISEALSEHTQLEKQVSFSLENETIDLDDPAAHAFQTRIVARVRKRPHQTTPEGASTRKD